MPPAEESVDALAERLLPSDLDALAAALSDERLAGFALAVVRQVRRRVARSGPRVSRPQGRRQGGERTGGGDPLGRALRQLADEIGGTAGE